MSIRFSIVRGAVAAGVLATASAAFAQAGVQSSDLLKLRSVSAVEVSPDGTRVAYVVENNDGAGRPYGQFWVMTIADGKSVRFGADKELVRRIRTGRPTASGSRIAAASATRRGLVVAKPDGSGARLLAEMCRHERAAPRQQARARMVARRQANRVRLVRRRALKPPTRPAIRWSSRGISTSRTPPKGMTRFNDNRRLHLFVVDVASGRVEQLTDGDDLRAFDRLVAERPGAAVPHESRRRRRRVLQLRRLRDEARRQIDPAAERDREQRIPPALVARRQDDRVPGDQARPHRSRDDDGGHARVGDERRRHEPARGRRAIDNRQGPPEWTPDGRAVLFTVQERGNVRLYRAADRRRQARGRRQRARHGRRFSTAKNGARLHARDAVRSGRQLYVAGRKMTDLNADVLARTSRLAEVESFTFVSNDNKFEVEAFLTKPVGLADGDQASADREHPRRPARPAGTGVQLQEPGLRRTRLGDADGELPRLDRLRPGVRRRRLRAIRTATKGRTCSTA